MRTVNTTINRRLPTNRSRITNNPLRRADGRSPSGRRVRDLYRALMADAGHPDGPVFQANALAAAELKAACEVERAKLLKGEGDIEQVIRLENLAARAIRRLGIRPVVSKSVGPNLGHYLAKSTDTEASP